MSVYTSRHSQQQQQICDKQPGGPLEHYRQQFLFNKMHLICKATQKTAPIFCFTVTSELLMSKQPQVWEVKNNRQTTSLMWLNTSSFSNCLLLFQWSVCSVFTWQHVWEWSEFQTYLWVAQGWRGYSETASSSCCAPQLQEENNVHNDTHTEENTNRLRQLQIKSSQKINRR